jgi:hypothetical protein
MTSHIGEMRDVVYFNFQGFADIYACFCFYCAREIDGAKDEKMNFDGGKTFSSFEFHKAKGKEDENDVLTKLLRLLANLFTLPKIGKDLMQKQPKIYRDMLKRLSELLSRREITQDDEQILCILSCLANVTFYEKLGKV